MLCNNSIVWSKFFVAHNFRWVILYQHGFTSLVLLYSLTGEESQDLGPPPSVDEAANTLMTRLGFLLGDKVNEGPGGAQYSMEEQDDPQVCYTHSVLSSALAPSSLSHYSFKNNSSEFLA